MRQPAFRLEPVLRVRRNEERAAALAAAAAARDAAEAHARAERDAEALAVRRPPTSATGAGFVAAMVASAAAAADVSAARALAVARTEQADLVRERWTEAAQRTKGLERLRERHLADLRRAADVAETRVVDDLVTRQHGAARRREEEGTWTD
ncbi:flagellar FliJ family protein [Modestobacter versicolor]|uniref:flagellar FliJ family protein n=1 Tax=Modestobacter versicolor TaxID=429133 RepID=UPI0034DE2659